jgi:hypothetical protein
MPKMYGELAPWWPLLSAPAHYEEEASFYREALLEAGAPPMRTLLELGSGGGNNASHLKARFEMVLVDRSPAMLAVSRRLNPECKHIEADMRTVRLEREFDGVFVHDAVCYMTGEDELRAVMETAFAHCRRGGAALFAPDYVRENFRAGTDCGGEDDGRRGLRYLEWCWDPEPSDSIYFVDYAYLVRDTDGSVRVMQDRHVEGLFARADWLRLLAEVGFAPRMVPWVERDAEPIEREVFVGVRR